MNLKRRLLSFGGAVVVGVASMVAAPGHVLAGYGPSQNCEDNGDDIPILGGPLSVLPGSPVTLGIEHGAGGVELCWSTSPYGFQGAEASGGSIPIWYGTSGTTVQCWNDPASSTQNSCDLIVSATPGGVSVSFPFTICAGACLLSGSISVSLAQSAGLNGATETVSECINVDGVQLPCAGATVGATLNGIGGVSEAPGPTCILNNLACLPASLGVTLPSATLYVPFLQPISLGGQKECIISNAGSC